MWRIRAWLIASFVILIWGVPFVNTRALLGDFSALEILVVRALCAGVDVPVDCEAAKV